MSLNVTPSRLRSYHAMSVASPKTTSWAPILASDCAMLADAVELADSAARSDIECYCDWAGLPFVGRWFDTSKRNPPEAADIAAVVEQAVRYLDARGLLIRDDKRPEVVSFKAIA